MAGSREGCRFSSSRSEQFPRGPGRQPKKSAAFLYAPGSRPSSSFALRKSAYEKGAADMTRALEPKVPESLEARPLGAQTKNRDFPLVASAGRQQSADGTLDSLRASSSTAEQRTLNPQVSGSNPEGRTEGSTNQPGQMTKEIEQPSICRSAVESNRSLRPAATRHRACLFWWRQLPPRDCGPQPRPVVLRR